MIGGFDMFGNLFGGRGDNDLFLIIIILFLFDGFNDGCGDRCDRGGIFDDNIFLIILLLLLLGDNDDCGCR